MNQVSDILALADQALSQNVDAVLATVVRTEGSAYRRPGAMMLICADGRSVGMVSGGCLERHLIERAFWLTRNGAWVQVYNTGSAADTDRRPARFGAAHLSFIDPLQALFMTDSDDLDGRDGFDKSHFEANAEDSELNSHLSNQTHDPIEANYDNYEDEDNDEEESYDSMSFG
ncbi:MAG: XdhC family protein, partial [Psychrobacter sp.]|nr:XdhC family protein [Psychrobacter sp.]